MPFDHNPLPLFYKRQAERAAGRRRGKLLPTPRPKQPKQVERAYLRSLVAVLSAAKELVNAQLVPQLAAILAKNARQDRQGTSAERADDAALNIAQMIEQLRVNFARKYSRAEAERLASAWARDAAGFSAEQIQTQFRRVLGVDAMTTSFAVEQEVRLAVVENVQLITSIPSQFFDQLEREVFEHVRRGDSIVAFQRSLAERYDVALSRATLIARDQTSKLNGVITEVTHTQLGITGYVWRTAGDARVRDMHAELDGQEFEYAHPPIVSAKGTRGNPGFDFNCRCYAEPNFKGLLPDDGD